MVVLFKALFLPTNTSEYKVDLKALIVLFKIGGKQKERNNLTLTQISKPVFRNDQFEMEKQNKTTKPKNYKRIESSSCPKGGQRNKPFQPFHLLA